jgi:hypothetical protein
MEKWFYTKIEVKKVTAAKYYAYFAACTYLVLYVYLPMLVIPLSAM